MNRLLRMSHLLNSKKKRNRHYIFRYFSTLQVKKVKNKTIDQMDNFRLLDKLDKLLRNSFRTINRLFLTLQISVNEQSTLNFMLRNKVKGKY